jgi:DNA-binding response OmpR family regulator
VTRILVVEDSEPLGRMLAQTLARAGHDAAWTATGAAALAAAAAAPPDVVLLDMHLADMEGGELAVQLRADLPTLRLIGVSGAPPEAAIVTQFDAFLLKPVALDTLLRTVTDP